MTGALHRTARPGQVGRAAQGRDARVRTAVLTVVVAGLLGALVGFVGDETRLVRPGPGDAALRPVGAVAPDSLGMAAQAASPPTASPAPSPSPAATPSPSSSPEQAADPVDEPDPTGEPDPASEPDPGGAGGGPAPAPGAVMGPPPAPLDVTTCEPVAPGSAELYRMVVEEAREQLDVDWPGAPGSSASDQPMTDEELVDYYRLDRVVDRVERYEIVRCDGSLAIVGMPPGHLEATIRIEVHIALVDRLT